MSRRRQQAGEANELDSLSREQLLSLNAAFNTVFSADDQPSPSKRQRTAEPVPEPPESSAAPGGFLVAEDAPQPAAGGFMTDSAPPPSISGFPSNIRRPPPPSSHAFTNKDTDMIPLTRIPNLLQTLDLPSDGQVLTAFETGADSDQEEEDAEHSNEMVSRRNFLRVCAVLLGNESDSDEEEQEDLGSDGQAGSEASFAPSDNDDDDNEDAEYVQGGFEPDASQAQSQRTTRASRRRRGGAQDLAMLDDDVEEDEQGIQHATSAPVSTKRKKDKGKQKAGELSGVQKQRASELFTAFLLEGEEMEVTHSRSWEELSQRTLGFNEIRRVATRVSVSLTDAEINEMLEMASSGSRSILTLGDFVQVMQQIRAV